jgi:hypothetical protein
LGKFQIALRRSYGESAAVNLLALMIENSRPGSAAAAPDAKKLVGLDLGPLRTDFVDAGAIQNLFALSVAAEQNLDGEFHKNTQPDWKRQGRGCRFVPSKRIALRQISLPAASVHGDGTFVPA